MHRLAAPSLGFVIALASCTLDFDHVGPVGAAGEGATAATAGGDDQGAGASGGAPAGGAASGGAPGAGGSRSDGGGGSSAEGGSTNPGSGGEGGGMPCMSDCEDAGLICCNGSCINPNNDIHNCGGCGSPPCGGPAPFCDNGECKMAPCNDGIECDDTLCCGVFCCLPGALCCVVPGPGPMGAQPMCFAPNNSGTCDPGCPACS